MARILIAGCGYVGTALALELVDEGHEVFGLRKDPSALPDGIRPVAADLTRLEGIGALPLGLDRIVFCVGAKSRDEAAYRAIYIDGLSNLLRVLTEEGQRPQRIYLTSSTSVYAQSRDEWVDEKSPAHPPGFAGQIQLAAEGLLHGSPYPSTVVRLAGIYGPERTSIIDRIRSGDAGAGPHFTNRIHRDDVSGLLAHLIAQDDVAPLLIGVDSEPARADDVWAWLAAELDLDWTPTSGEDTPRRRTGSKRCRNDLLLSTGYALRYPTYREGYAELIACAAAGGA
jgi:nucleoside-diphosphate-sugar epimerase